MSLFTVAQKRAFLASALSRALPLMGAPQNSFEALQDFGPEECQKRLQTLDESTLDELISTYIHAKAQRIAAQMNTATSRPALQPA